nr:hypothetical protein [Tanacetum cinerariifolium]
PEYPKYLAPAEAPIEDKPLPDEPTALSPGYFADFNLEEDLKEDPKEDPAYYHADGGDDADDESSNFDDDKEHEASEDDDEQKEHQALVDSSAVLVDDPILSAEDTEAFEIDESAPTPVPSPRRRMARMQAGHTLAHRVDYGFVDTMNTSIHASESRAMTAIGEVNDRVTDLATTQRQDAQELYVHYEDAQDDRALLRAQVFLLTRERRYFSSTASSYERERQRIRDEDRLTTHIQNEHDRFRDLVYVAEAGPQDGPEDAGGSC